MDLTFDFELIFLLWVSASPLAYLRTRFGGLQLWLLILKRGLPVTCSISPLKTKGPIILFILRYYLSDTLSLKKKMRMMGNICLCILGIGSYACQIGLERSLCYREWP